MADMKEQELELYRQRRTAEARAASIPPSAAVDGRADLEQLTGEIDAKGEESRLILAYVNVTRRGSRVILMLKGNSAMLAWWDVFTDLAGLTGGVHARIPDAVLAALATRHARRGDGGLFFDPSDLTGFAVIAPLGLAFLAGYGVELLFTGLDRMVSAFTGEGAERPRAV